MHLASHTTVIDLVQREETSTRRHGEGYAAPSQVETELLLNINQSSVSAAGVKRCAELTKKQRTKGLSEPEQAELSVLVDEIELLNARRLGYLSELAQVSEVPIEEIMQRLDIQPITYG